MLKSSMLSFPALQSISIFAGLSYWYASAFGRDAKHDGPVPMFTRVYDPRIQNNAQLFTDPNFGVANLETIGRNLLTSNVVCVELDQRIFIVIGGLSLYDRSSSNRVSTVSSICAVESIIRLWLAFSDFAFLQLNSLLALFCTGEAASSCSRSFKWDKDGVGRAKKRREMETRKIERWRKKKMKQGIKITTTDDEET
ncbi:hypothetical protein DFH29DRAFT_327792 [Suillus ampliporus]|nr:hypothetical protein DFH29DRAFT_327792 [Suillus ampliporus]